MAEEVKNVLSASAQEQQDIPTVSLVAQPPPANPGERLLHALYATPGNTPTERKTILTGHLG